MRISDWSSDVCSSDLLESLGREKFADAFKRAAQVERAFGNINLARLDLGVVENVVDDREKGIAGVFHRFGIGPRGGGELGAIGRASCRAVVCHEVLISVVGVTLKNKIKI